MAATEEEQVSLKLLVSKETNKVIFAEAEKDFVDILCSFLTLPLGTIARLVQKESNLEPVTVGCLNSLYQSVTVLDKGCFWNETSKTMLLQPKNLSEDYCRTLQLNVDDTVPTKYFICSMVDASCKSHSSTSAHKNCPHCRSPMSSSAFLKNFSKGFVNSVATFLKVKCMQLVNHELSSHEVYLKGPRTYVVTDDLVIATASPVSTLDLINHLGTPRKDLQEKVVTIGYKECLNILKASLTSTSALTNGLSHLFAEELKEK